MIVALQCRLALLFGLSAITVSLFGQMSDNRSRDNLDSTIPEPKAALRLLDPSAAAKLRNAVQTESNRPVLPISHSGDAVIRWDVYGIPHIYGPDLLTVVRGLGYAQMENHAETLLTNTANARGRAAEYFGPGVNNVNVTNDIKVRTENIPARSADWLARGGLFQRLVIEAFTEGVNEYAARHGDTIDPSIRRVLPFVPTDVTAGEQNTIHFTFMPTFNNIAALTAAWQTGGITAANTLAGTATPEGSNAWALAPSKSTTGNALLMGNPHLPWGNNQPIPNLGLFQWMEANLVIGDPAHPKLNATGVMFLGAPFINIGFNDSLGWSNTVNTIQNTNLYQITLNADGTYKFGAGTEALKRRGDVIRIRQTDGSLRNQPLTIAEAVQGPLIAQSGNQALALRVAGLDQPAIVTEFWEMMASQNIEEFVAANSSLQIPFFNFVYADRDGHILYHDGGRHPMRSGGSWASYTGILDGSDPSLVWTKTLNWFSLPQAIDPPGGFVANENDPPWTSSFPQVATNNPANYPAWIAPQSMDLRPQHAARFLLSQSTFTADQVLSGKEQTDMLLAERVVPDLIAAARTSGDPTAISAAAVLAAWDYKSDMDSKGAVLFERWFDIVSRDPAITKDNTINYFSIVYAPRPKFRVGWSNQDPLETPMGLADPAGCVPDLIAAAQQVQAQYGALDVAWGTVHKVVLSSHDAAFTTPLPVSHNPASGSGDTFGGIRIVEPFPAPDGSHDFWSYDGDTYVELVEFTREGAKARELLGYGNASRPGSTHITDQLPAFDSKTLLPVWRTLPDVAEHTVTQEKY